MNDLKPLFLAVILVFLSYLTSAQSMQVPGGIDTAGNITWWEQPMSPTLTARIEKQWIQSDYLVVLHCDGSFFGEEMVTVPKTCSDQFNQKNKKLSEDSLTKWFESCIRNYHYANPKKSKIDTIYTASAFNDDNFPGLDRHESTYFLTKVEIFNADSTFYIKKEFYPISELKNTCFTGEEGVVFRSKSVEGWENGKKEGPWKYYDKTGKLIHLIDYQKGKMIREERY